MNVDIIDPFLDAVYTVVSELTGEKPCRELVGIDMLAATTQPVTIALEVTGDIEGHALYGMSIVTAVKFASILLGEKQPMFSDTVNNAINEFGNKLGTCASLNLSGTSINCDIKLSTVVRGVNIELSTISPVLIIPVRTKFGRLDVTVSLLKKNSELAQAA